MHVRFWLLAIVTAILLITGAAWDGLGAGAGAPADAKAGADAKAAADGSPPRITLIDLVGIIDPFTASFVTREIASANRRGDEAIIIRMDTPGGLDTSMRDIIKEMLASRAPVVVWVAPPGARAASAGAFVTIAADVAAMAPGTNIGAAHPVNLGGGSPQGDEAEVLTEKATNDAIAYIRALAERRGRNADWAEDAVRNSVSVQASEAKRLNVIDFIAEDRAALLSQLDGFDIGGGRDAGTGDAAATGDSQARIIRATGARVTERTMNWREALFHTIVNPNVAFILMLIGIYGIFFELANPGSFFPGVIGAISIVLALIAFQALPINTAGVILILLAIAMFALDIFAPSHGALTIGGLVAFFFGSLILVDLPGGASISLAVIIPAVIVTGAFFLFALGAGLRAQRRRPTIGTAAMIGMRGEVREDIAPAEGMGLVMVNGALWKAASEAPLARGQQIRVTGIEGLILQVEPEEPGGAPYKPENS